MRKMILLVSLMMVILLGTASVAGAFDIRQQKTGLISVGKNETVNDDLVLAGETVVIEGTINGDVLALGEVVTVTGIINGNLLAFGERVELKGSVNGAVITVGETVTIEGTVERSLITAGSRVTLTETAQVGRSLIAGADRLEHRGIIERGVAAGGSDLRFSGKVGKEIRAGGERLEFASNAVVNGPVDYWSANQARVAAGAQIGAITHHAPSSDWENATRPWYLRPGSIILKFGGFLVVGLVFLFLFPLVRSRFPEIMATHPWQAPLAGFLALIATPITAIILMVTVIGLPLGLITLLAYPVLIYVSQIFVAWSVGRLLADRVPELQYQSWPVLFLTGAVLTTLLMEIPIVGRITTAASLFFGLGTIWLLVTKRNRAV